MPIIIIIMTTTIIIIIMTTTIIIIIIIIINANTTNNNNKKKKNERANKIIMYFKLKDIEVNKLKINRHNSSVSFQVCFNIMSGHTVRVILTSYMSLSL